MEIGKMEALGEEAGWKREDEGGQAMESLGTGVRWGLLPSLLLCWWGGLAGETGAGALIIYFLLILLWIEMKL